MDPNQLEPISWQLIKQPLKNIKNVLVNQYRQLANLHPAPIFILGHQKSGTTVIASLLSQITGKALTLDPFYRIEGRKAWFREQLLKQELDFNRFIREHKFYFSTALIKDPDLIFIYHQVRQCFPEAKFIFIVRDPRDNIRSILNRLNIPGNLPVLDPDSQQPTQAWELILKGKLPEIRGNNYIEKLAGRWNLATDTYLNHSGDMVLIRYEDFVRDKVGSIGNLARQVNLEPIHDISEGVERQYGPRGDRQISYLDFFGVDNLRRIEMICDERMKYYGYFT